MNQKNGKNFLKLENANEKSLIFQKIRNHDNKNIINILRFFILILVLFILSFFYYFKNSKNNINKNEKKIRNNNDFNYVTYESNVITTKMINNS